MSFIHKIFHKIGWYNGDVVTRNIKGSFYVGFKCSTCGKVEGWHNAQKTLDRILERDLHERSRR